MYEKAIIYDPETRDFAMYLDGMLVGFARTYADAETTLDEVIAELMAIELMDAAAILGDPIDQPAA